MKLSLLFSGAIILLGAASLYYIDQQYIRLGDSERLFNGAIYKDVYDGKLNWELIDDKNHQFKTTYTNLTDESSASERLKVISDYSLKIMNNCGTSGTGWFLDHEIPEDNNKYPKKWFIATNAHVISDFKFQDNPYNQPISSKMNSNLCYSSQTGHTQLFLIKEKTPENWSQYTNESINWGNEVDNIESVLKQKAKSAKENADDKFLYSRIDNPKLFYTAINFLGPRYKEKYSVSWEKINYVRDFAVLEVNFETEEEAKNLTRDLYGKLQDQSYKKLNFFSKELLKKEKQEEVWDNKEDYFFISYPGSYEENLIQLSLEGNDINNPAKLIIIDENYEYAIKNKHNKSIMGHHSYPLSIQWNGVEHTYWGYEYVLFNMKDSRGGSSGSLVVDSKGDVLGVLTSVKNSDSISKQPNIAFVTPLRSEGWTKDSKIIFPKYDLIIGSRGQKGSYKDQLNTYYPNIKTYLNKNRQFLEAIK